jgi:penicillin-binding protein 1A
MMKIVVNSGTATLGVRDNAGFRGDAAAKTGTTSSWSDAWIAGFNPEITTVYWVGFDRSSVTLGAGQAGGHIASPVMGHFLNRMYKETKRTPPSFPDKTTSKPDSVVIGPCGGLGMAPGTVHGEMKKMPAGDNCAGADSRIYDQRELLMKELGITPDDLGSQGKVKFKN